jgi:hypothetical protein
MRTHRDIIQQAGAEAVRLTLGCKLSIHTVRSWQQRNAIPAEHWLALSKAGTATLDELATAAANDATAQDRAA